MTFLWLTNSFALTIVVKGLDKKAPVYSNPDNNDVPIIEATPGTRYEVLETQGEWYKVSVQFEEGFNITGWIHASSVVDAEEVDKEKSLVPQPSNENPDWESMEKKKSDEMSPKEIGEPVSSPLLKEKKSSAPKVHLEFELGAQIKDYTLKNASTTADPNPVTIIDYGNPQGLITGISGSYYFYNFNDIDIGIDGEYSFSWYRYDVVINNNQSSDTLTSYVHSINPNMSFRYVISYSKHFVSVSPRLGFRFISFSGDDATDAGQPVLFSVNNSIMGLNIGLLNGEYLFPPTNRDIRFGIHGTYDTLIKPSYSESKVDSDGDGAADDVITGLDPSMPLFNHIASFSVLMYLYTSYSVRIGYQLSDFDINFSGSGSRLNFPITDGRVNDNYHNVFLKVGYLF